MRTIEGPLFWTQLCPDGRRFYNLCFSIELWEVIGAKKLAMGNRTMDGGDGDEGEAEATT